VSLLLLALVVGGGYLAWTWGPVYVLHFEARQVVRDYMSRAIKVPTDAVLVEGMLRDLRALDQQEVPDESGKLVKVPTIQVDPTAVTWERDSATAPPSLHVAFEYTRDVPYPLLKRWTEKTLSIDFTEDLVRPDWGPSR
jgi:hypothetical protein